jgi:peptidoglycan/LPS O-acetylase OafA/YrhL
MTPQELWLSTCLLSTVSFPAFPADQAHSASFPCERAERLEKASTADVPVEYIGTSNGSACKSDYYSRGRFVARRRKLTPVHATRGIPSLDGLRAFSIALVILAHCFMGQTRFSGFPVLAVGLLGQYGVDVFFVISGFLITHLLLRELDANGTISLRRFYLRRFFRIFPPFYVFLGILAILWAVGAISLNARDYLNAARYTYNYDRRQYDWLLGHCWSLSLEEQFYLLWPPCLALLGRKKSTYLALGIIVLSPVSRLVSYYVAPHFRGIEGLMLHTRLDTIMFGCAIALVYEHESFDRLMRRILNPQLVLLSGFFLLIVSPLIEARFLAWYTWPVGYTLIGLSISAILLYVVRNPASVAGRVLNAQVIRHLGVISYSIYLWQQMFTGPRTFWFPLNLFVILACAEASFFLVERPSFRLRDLLESRLRVFSRPLRTPPQRAHSSV